MDPESRIYLQALYELTLEACGGNKQFMKSLPESELPKILESDVEKRYYEIKKRQPINDV